jgi:IS4 transposase
MTYNMRKTQLFLHQAIRYSQIYNFILNHGYKFKIIIMFKDILILKSKRVYVFLFYEYFEHMDPFSSGLY